MLRLDKVTFRYGGRLLLEEASAFIAEGHKVGLVGRNGAGKSTLFKLIIGELSLESGSIDVPRRTRIGMVAQEAPGTDDSLLDTVLAADKERAALLAEVETTQDPDRMAEAHIRLADIDAYTAPSRAAAILSGLGFPAEDQARPCRDFSGGWRMRVALAAMLFSNPELLLLDEPTNYLDLEGVMWLESFLSRYRGTVIVISHDRDLLNRAVDEILHLEDRKLTAYTGNYDRFEELRRIRLENQSAQRTRQESERQRIQSFIDRFKAKATKARQAQSRMKALARMKPIADIHEDASVRISFPEPEELAPPVITLDQVAVGYDGKPILRNLSLRIDQDDRIALLGSNGNGKSTFSKLIAGKLECMAGSMGRSSKLRIGYFAQHQLDGLHENWTPFQHVAEVSPGMPVSKIRARIGAFGFGADKADLLVSKLSGGEKARLVLALISVEAPHLLILDEPTNHLDIDAREALIQALNSYKGAAILVSHDRHLLDATADQLWLVANGTVKPYDGDLDDYRAALLAKNDEGGKPSQAAAFERRKGAAKIRNDLAPLRRAADKAEARMNKLVEERSGIENELSDPKLYELNPNRATLLARRRGELNRAIDEAEEEWLAAAETYETARRESAA
jgi:ATP-binding cassette subfamily F protein 3